VVSLPDNDDPDTFLQKHGAEVFAARLRQSVKFMDFVLAQVVAKGPVATIDEKVEKAREMLEFIAKLASGIERDYYLKKTAEALDLDEAVLRQEMPKLAKHATTPAAAKTTVLPRGHRPKAEEILVHLMLKDEGIARSLQKQLKPQDFSDPLLQRTVQRIFEVLSAGGNLNVRALLSEGDEELNSLISHYTVLEADYEDLQKHCQDCVELIKQRDPAKKMNLLWRAIKEAETRGDTNEVTRLIREQNELYKRPDRKIPGL
jgi:DNA primase